MTTKQLSKYEMVNTKSRLVGPESLPGILRLTSVNEVANGLLMVWFLFSVTLQ